MYRTVADFKESWQRDSDGMQKVLDALTDESLEQAVADDHRTMGRIAWHIVTSIPEMANRIGLEVTSATEKDPVPTSAKKLADAYREASRQLTDQITSKWTDETLEIVDDMYGMQWARGLTLSILVEHQIHHRGQMTVLMRQAGVAVPGVYGPSKEEWSKYGMEEPSI